MIVKKAKKKLSQISKFENAVADDVLELFPGSAAEARGWMAALHSPKYLLSRGMGLVGSLNSDASSVQQTDARERQRQDLTAQQWQSPTPRWRSTAPRTTTRWPEVRRRHR